MTKALLITATLLFVLASHPSLSLASSSFTSPVPNYQPPQVMGESTNNNPDSGSFANLGYSLMGLVLGSGAISGVAIYKKRRQKNQEEINFVDPQTN